MESISEIPVEYRAHVNESLQDFEVKLQECFLYSNVASNGLSYHLVHPDKSFFKGYFLVATWNAYGFHFCHKKHLERNSLMERSAMRDPIAFV